MPQGRKKPSQIDQIVAGASAQFLDEEADRQGVPRDFARKIAGIESSGRADVISGQRQSSAGAVGKMQLMPGTARDLGVDPNHLEQNVQGGVMYLRQQLDAFGGDQRKAAAAYNAGPGAVRKYGGVPPFPETQKYANQFPSGEESDIDRIVRSVGQTAQPEPEPSTLRIVPGRQQTTVRGPTRPSAPNPFALTGPTGFEQAGQQVAARTAQISPEVAAQADRRAARIEADRRRYGQKSVVGKRLEDVGEAFAGIGESAQRGFQNLTYPVRKGLSAVSPTIAARLKAGEEAQAHTAQRMGERAQAADSLASKTTRALTSGAVGATTMIPVAMAGGIPAVMAVTGLQQDWSDPKAAALNTALSGLPIAAGRAISPAASRVAGRAFTAPVAQEAARRGIEAGAGGVTNVGQYAGTQALLGRPIDPEEALAQGVAGGVLGTAMAPGRRQAAAMARPRSPIDIPVYDDAGEVAGYDRVDAPLTPDVVGQGVNRAGDLGATGARRGILREPNADVRVRPRTAPMPIQNRLASLTPAPDAPATRAMPPLDPTQIPAQPASNPLAILQENANEAKINAAQFEQAGDWESAQREYDVAHKTLVEAQRQMRRVRNQTPEQADALSAIAREISGAALNRNRASRSATVARREQGIAGRQARKAQEAVENAPTADLPGAQPDIKNESIMSASNPLLKSVVNPESGILQRGLSDGDLKVPFKPVVNPEIVPAPISEPSEPSPTVDLTPKLQRQVAQSRRKSTSTLSAIEYLKRKTNREGIRVGDRGEARVLGAREEGIVGLTNRRSKFTTSDAQVMLDEGGFNLPDGRKFTDPSVTENDVLAFLAESGREGRMNTRDLDQRIEREAAEYEANRPTGEVRPASSRLPRIADLPPSRVSRPLEPIPRGTESDRPLTVREQARKAGGVTGDLEVMDRLARRQGVERPRDYAERTSYGEPGSGASLSQYTDMMRGNRAAFDQLRGMNVDSVEAQEIVARIEDYNERHAVAPHHLENELNTIRGEQAGTARRADLGIGSAPLRDPSTAELRDFYSRPDETRAPSAPLRPVRREAAQMRQPEPVAETPRVVVPEKASGNVADTIAEDLRRLHAMNPEELDQSLRQAEARRNEDIRNPRMNEVERRMNRDLLKFANERRHEMVRAKQLPAKSPRGPARGERPTAKEAAAPNPLEQDVTILDDGDLAKRIRDAETILNRAPDLNPARRKKVEEFRDRAILEKDRRQSEIPPEVKAAYKSAEDRMSAASDQMRALRPSASDWMTPDESRIIADRSPVRSQGIEREAAKIRVAAKRKERARTVSHPDPAIDGQLVLATTADGRVIVANEGNKSGVSVVKDRLTTEPKPDRAPIKYAIPDEAMPELNPNRERGNQPPPMPDRVTARDLADNVRAEYRPAANRPGTVYLNDWGLEALNAADYLEFRAGREGAADDRITGGVNYPPEEARQIADHIRERAGRPNFSENGRKNLETMARQIELAADDGNVSFVPMQGQAMRQARQTIRHEAFHSQQSAVHPDVHNLTTPRWLRAQKFGAAIGEELSRRGYSERQHPAEAAAFVASGNWDAFGMNRDDAREFLTEYFDNVAYRHGKEAINKFRAIHPALQEVVEARRGTNEPRFGSPGLGRGTERAINRQRGVERPGGSVARSRSSVPSGNAGSVRGQSQTAALRAITPESLRAGQPVESAPTQSPRRQGLAGIRAEDLRAPGAPPPPTPRSPREPVSGVPTGKDVSGFDYLRSRLSNLNFTGTYERLAGARGREVSEIIRNAQVEIARQPDTERASLVSDLRRQLQPFKAEFRDNGQPGLANWMDAHVDAINDADAAFKGLAGFLRGSHYNTKLRYNPKSAALNSLQPLQTLWPHVTTREFAKLMRDARAPSIRGRVLEIAERESGGQVEEVSKRGRFEAVPKVLRNPFAVVSDTNRVVGHLAGEMFADRMGLTGHAKARMAADWAKKIEYDNSRWDVPPLFSGRLAGVIGQFKPFTIKNLERLHADWKAAPEGSGTGNLARRAKMITGQVVLGGVRSIPGVKQIGGVLVLGALARAFSDVGLDEDDANKAAEAVYFGAPGLIEQDISSSMMILDAPFGNTPAEQAVNYLGGPTLSLIVKAFKEGETMIDAQGGRGSTAADKRKAAGIRLAKAVTPYSKTVEAAADLVQGKRPALKMERRQVPMTNLEVAGKLGMATPLRQSKFYEEKDAYDWQKRAARKLKPARP